MQALTQVFIHALELLFALGLLGSALVILLTAVEDSRELTDPAPDDDARSSPASTSGNGY